MPNHPNRGQKGPSANPTPADIRAAREAAELSQEDAAALVHSNLRSWQKWEGDETCGYIAVRNPKTQLSKPERSNASGRRWRAGVNQLSVDRKADAVVFLGLPQPAFQTQQHPHAVGRNFVQRPDVAPPGS